MPKICKYRIYCTTASQWEYIWDTSAPTTCPVDGGHTVNVNSVSELTCIRRIQEIDDTNSPYTITGHNFYKADTTAGNITINLKPAGENKDRVITFQKISSSNTLTIDGNGAETVGGSATQILNNNKETLKIQSNGTNWIILSIKTNIGDNKLDGTLYDDNFAKGDIIINNGLDTTALTGTDNTFLKVDSAQPSGLIFVTETVLGDSNVAAAAGINANKLADGSVSNTEYQYINSLTSNAQTQLDARTVGPGSSTDNAIVRFDGITGKLTQNSGVTIDDNNNVVGTGYIQIVDVAAPINPGAGIGRMYKKIGDDGIFWKPDAAGAELDLTRASTLTVAEVTQLENIDATTITSTQWGYIGIMNQSVATTAAPTFAGATMTANLSMGSNKITGLAAPTADTDAVTKAYVDGAIEGLDVKQSVRVGTTTAGALASDFENGDTVDGVVLATGNRILIKDQAAGAENGIYIVQASGAPIRADDLLAGASAANVYTFVEEGTANADNGWVCTNDVGSDVVGTNALNFVQFSGVGQVIAGDGLSKLGNQLNVNVDSTSIEINLDILRIVNAPTVKGDILTHNGTIQTKLAAATTNNYVLVADSTAATGMKWAEVPVRLWILQDVKATGTFGGTATGDGAWRKRDLNTVKINGGADVTLATDQITLTAGSYHIVIRSSFYRTESSRIRLYNTTDTAAVEHSMSTYASDLDRDATVATIDTYVSIGSTKVYEIQYACDNTETNDGLGIPNGISGVSEIYTVASIKKV